MHKLSALSFLQHTQVRTKLAPIRGIPTKQGLQNPNQDILDIFAAWDQVPKIPQIVFGGLTSCEFGFQ